MLIVIVFGTITRRTHAQFNKPYADRKKKEENGKKWKLPNKWTKYLFFEKYRNKKTQSHITFTYYCCVCVHTEHRERDTVWQSRNSLHQIFKINCVKVSLFALFLNKFASHSAHKWQTINRSRSNFFCRFFPLFCQYWNLIPEHFFFTNIILILCLVLWYGIVSLKSIQMSSKSRLPL